MKKVLSLILCGVMLLSSTGVFAEAIGYKFDDMRYYFEPYTKEVSFEDTVYLTVSNTRISVINDEGYCYENLDVESETVITIVQPMESFRVAYYVGGLSARNKQDVFNETNVPAGKTYTLKDLGDYEYFINNESSGIITIYEKTDNQFSNIYDKQYAIDNKYDLITDDGSETPVATETTQVPQASVITKPTEVPQASVIAKPTDTEIVVGKGAWLMDAYNINDNNYFKLRDIAFSFTYEGVNHPFEVTWDGAKNAISLISEKNYTPVGGECGGYDPETDSWPEPDWEDIINAAVTVKPEKQAQLTTSAVYINGVKVDLTAYNIDGNNYFKLRDLAQALDFAVEWNSVENRIYVETDSPYIPE